MEQQQHQERPREVYRECMRNHAAKLGTYASDGCCEYTLDDGHLAVMLCAACGCHCNFHRKAFLDAVSGATGAASPHVAPMLPCPSAAPGYGMHHIVMIAAAGMGDGGAHDGHGLASRRRTRTKFTEEQKERMLRFAERLGWRMPKREPGRPPGDDEVARFCREIGVTRQVFKVWMHNHKAGGGSGGAGAGGAAQTSSSTTRGGGRGVGSGGGSMSPAMGGNGEDDEEVRGNEMCM